MLLDKIMLSCKLIHRIRPEDVGYDSKPGSNGSTKIFKADQNDGADPLVSFNLKSFI